MASTDRLSRLHEINLEWKQKVFRSALLSLIVNGNPIPSIGMIEGSNNSQNPQIFTSIPFSGQNDTLEREFSRLLRSQ